MPHIWMHRLIERINSALIVIQAQVQAYFRAPQKQQQLTNNAVQFNYIVIKQTNTIKSIKSTKKGRLDNNLDINVSVTTDKMKTNMQGEEQTVADGRPYTLHHDVPPTRLFIDKMQIHSINDLSGHL